VKIGTTITIRPALAAGVLISLPRAASVATVRVCSRFFPAGWAVPALYWCHLLQPFCFSHSCAGAVASHNGKRLSSAYGERTKLAGRGTRPTWIILLDARACTGARGSRLRRRCLDRARGTARNYTSPELGWSRRCARPRKRAVAAP